MNSFSRRIQALRKKAAETELDTVLVFDPENRRYITGFQGSTGYAVITADEGLFVTDSRYVEQAAEQCPDFEVVAAAQNGIVDFLRQRGTKKLGIEENSVPVRFYKRLRSEGGIDVVLPIDDALRDSRMIKDDDEQARIRRASEITDLAFEFILGKIRAGMTEIGIDRLLQDFMRAFPEVERMAERFIVASGERGSMPHGIAGEREIRDGEFVTIDFGCNCCGYWSDVTRTVCVGKANEEQKKIYNVVLGAQETAMRHIHAGAMTRDVDSAARRYIAERGCGEYFRHNLGHSYGLGIHEAPNFSPDPSENRALEAGMVMTVEPGVYIPGFGGVRIEDDVIVTEQGFVRLTQSAKNLIEL